MVAPQGIAVAEPIELGFAGGTDVCGEPRAWYGTSHAAKVCMLVVLVPLSGTRSSFGTRGNFVKFTSL